jgi:hypothetical protein
VDLQVAELALDHEHPGAHVGVLERDAGQRLDVEPGGDLDDLRRHPRARERAADPRPQRAHGLRLELVEEDEGPQVSHRRAP